MSQWELKEATGSDFTLYSKYNNIDDSATIDRVLKTVSGLLSKGEAAINTELTELAAIDPGQLDQSRLMAAQMNMSRWQLAAQLLSNFASGVATGLKNTLQNVGR